MIYGCAKKSATDNSGSVNISTTLATNMSAIKDSVAPASLDYPSTTASIDTAAVDFCEGFAEPKLFTCQPKLLRVYLQTSEDMFKLVQGFVAAMGAAIGNVTVGTSGTFTDGALTGYYKRTSDAAFSLLVKSGESALFYLSATDTTATFQMDMDEMKKADPASGVTGGKLDVSMTYTDANNWTISTKILNSPCDTADVRAPRNFHIKTSRVAGVWKGKAMLYNPIWASGVASVGTEPTCDTVSTTDISMAMYTEYVANDIAAKAKVYMMKKDVSTKAGVASYPLNSFCSTYGISSQCTAAGIVLSTYANPFCNNGTTDTATWNSDCATLSTELGAAEFTSENDWITPSDFSDATITKITLPTSLQ